jgi:hypothetical protein
MKQYRFLNLLLGWITFLIATIVYLMTVEPTTSLWDCGEFIASAFKLEVGHPPGAPFYMILARIFSLFAGSNVANAAKMINSLSALVSSFTILFLFWTITHLSKKIIIKNEEYSSGNIIAVMASGLVGALAYTFSDTFWFSAVEGEVYATSSLFTAVVFWAILQWENVANEKYSERWLILIAYLMGLSLGVHLLNLLAIPAIVFVYYFKKFEVNIKGFLYAVLISIVLLGVILYGIIPGIVNTSTWFELLFINTFGLPYNSGVLIHVILLISTIIGGIYYTYKKEKLMHTAVLSAASLTLLGIPFLSGSAFLNFLLVLILIGVVYYISKNNRVIINTIITASAVIFIGYSSFAMIIIRSLANPPMDENNPETVFSLLYYLNREQYGDRPLITGQYYNAPAIDVEDGRPIYTKKNGKYVITWHAPEVKYDKRFITFFPRMWSNNATEHPGMYEQWGNIKGKPVQVTDRNGERKTVYVPTFTENLRFFFSYQIGHMYFRYFMWNFSGRQNDIQGHGDPLKGNWITGIKFLDEVRLGPQDDLPESLKSDTARNKYYLLPFLLGLMGLFYQLQSNKKDFWVVLLLFVLTGIAIVVYLNQYPNQPRERDYAYAGSFYAFTIWIGLGVLALYDFIRKFIPDHIGAVVSGVICIFLVPGIIANENWSDHDRSGRYTARDIAYNYLNSCAPNAILFTNGDNDTFPLWYAQEVEGIRTDVRVVNLMLFNTDWYIDQMKNKVYDSDPVPISLPQEKYIDGTNNYINMIDRFKDYIDIKRVIDFIKDDNPATKIRTNENELLDYIPTRMFRLPVDSAKVITNGTVLPELADLIVPSIDIKLNKSLLTKNQMMVLDVLATNNWERPVYFVTGGHEDALGLEDYFQLEGFAYRLVPVKTERSGFLEYGRINTDVMYENLMNKFKWGGMEEPDLRLGYYEKRTFSVVRVRNNFARLAKELLLEGKRDSAVAVLDRCMELMPHERIPYHYFMPGIIEVYYKADETVKADQIAEEFAWICEDNLSYYLSFKPGMRKAINNDIQISLQLLQMLTSVTKEYNPEGVAVGVEEKFNRLYSLYLQTAGQS